MGIRHCDNWSIYGGPGNEAHVLDGVYADRGSNGQGNFLADPSGASGYVWRYDGGSINTFNSCLRYIYPTVSNIAGKAFRQWLTGLPTLNTLFPIPFSFRDTNNNPIVDVCVQPNGGFLVRNYIVPEVYAVTGPAITANAWWHLECKVNITAGSIELRVEGVTVFLMTGKNLGTLPVGMEAYSLQNNFAQWPYAAYAKDVVYWDGLGTQNIDFLGSVIVASLIPNADVADPWAPTPAGPGWSILANAPPQDGVQYITASNALPAAYVGKMSSITGDITAVLGLMTFVRAGKTDGGTGTFQVGLISSPLAAPATTLGANRSITTAQAYWRDVFELDPKTAAPWLPAAVNVAQIQLNRTS